MSPLLILLVITGVAGLFLRDRHPRPDDLTSADGVTTEVWYTPHHPTSGVSRVDERLMARLVRLRGTFPPAPAEWGSWNDPDAIALRKGARPLAKQARIALALRSPTRKEA